VADCVIERRILVPESFASVPRWRVAIDGAGTFLGALNSLPHHVLMNAPDDPLLDEARLRPIAGLLELEAAAPESYYVNIIAFRNPQGRGLPHAGGKRLARLEGFADICTFDADDGRRAFYRRLAAGT
jgi:hypothetical protein